MPVCRECIQYIKFIALNNGRKMPVNADMVDVATSEGTDKFILNGEVITGRLAKPGERAKKAYVPHWATCTAPDKFRKKEGDEQVKAPRFDDMKNSARLFMTMTTIR